ncbi:MAG TPA: hypothetical protein VNT03_02650 [Baekduia sp.]|nr:hypothetical protein [Baekduia sp.]
MSHDFAVRCTGCEFTWNTPAMVEGLRVLGACPKCKGALEFRDDGTAAAGLDPLAGARGADVFRAPHLVLGIPRI